MRFSIKEIKLEKEKQAIDFRSKISQLEKDNKNLNNILKLANDEKSQQNELHDYEK